MRCDVSVVMQIVTFCWVSLVLPRACVALSGKARGYRGGQRALNADHLALGGLASSLAAFVAQEQLGVNLDRR